jgi:hypothetical protein
VQDASVCRAVLQRALEEFSERGSGWIDLTPGSYDFGVFRFGPYYAVLLRDVREYEHVRTGWSPLLIFRVTDLEYVAGFAV